MTIATITVGPVEVVALLDCDADLDTPIIDAFPAAPPGRLLEMASTYPGIYGAGDVWHLFVRAWLVRHAGGTLLVDTGIGPASAPAQQWFPRPGRLHDVLAEAGATADEVDTVVISHVHDDHVGGGVTDGGEPAFPHARYVLQRADLEAQRAWAADNDEDRVIWEVLVRPLEDAGVLDVIEGDLDLSEQLALRHAPGHTPGHQVVFVDAGGDRLLLSADTWNHPAQLANPDWSSGTDVEPALAASTRRALLADMRAHEGTVVAPTHFAEAFGTITAEADEPAVWKPMR